MTGYGDPELLVGRWLRDRLNIKVFLDPNLPADWPFTAPIAHLQRGSGLGASPLSLDDVVLDIDVYAAKADSARKTADDIWSAMTLGLQLTTFPNGVLVKLSQAVSQPTWAPDPKVYRRTAAYRVLLHGFVS